MNSRQKNYLSVAVIALIGLAGASVAFAQRPGPPRPDTGVVINSPSQILPLRCQSGLISMSVLHGKIDNFASGVDSPTPTPSDALKAQYPALALPANIFDNTSANYLFGDTLLLSALPAGSTITIARLSTRLKPNGNNGPSSSNNDTITLQSGSSKFGYSILNLTPNATNPKSWGNNNSSQTGGVNFVFTMTSTVSQSPSSPPYTPAFLTALATNKNLDVLLQDDTSVDYLRLDVCYKPPAPKYDLVAAKKHDGSVYTLNVHNSGSQIMPTGRVDVVEVVPAGLVITGAGGAPWQCPGVIFPVTGPDSFTCSYQIPAGGITAGANLPPIVLKTEGKPECPNCMRVKLYLKSVSAGQKPVNEADNKNNASCTK